MSLSLRGLPHYLTLISSRLPHYQIKRPPSMTTNEPQTNVHPLKPIIKIFIHSNSDILVGQEGFAAIHILIYAAQGYG